MFIYQLVHEYWESDYDPSGKRLGYFSSLEKVKEARSRYLTHPGFSEHPEGFLVIKHIINAESCTGVWVVDLIFDEYMEDFISLGVFESKESAKKNVEHYKNTRGTDVSSGYFHIEEYPINETHWEEGFFSYFHD